MTFTINPRVLSVLSLAVVSVAGEWTGGYNTSVPSGDAPARKCWIKGFDSPTREYTAVFPCTCTAGKVSADCNWYQASMVYNAVRDAECRCATTKALSQQPEGLQKFSKSEPNAVTLCLCDPAEEGKGKVDTDGLFVPAPNCWCPAELLKENSGLKEAKEGEAVMEEPAPVDAAPVDAAPVDAAPVDAGPVDAGPVDAGPVDAAAVQKCSTELDSSVIVKPNLCADLKKDKSAEMTEPMQSVIPSCTIALLHEICKSN
ncbi:hypothetical protein MY10362_005218 [Beauveria mimosiformis]